MINKTLSNPPTQSSNFQNRGGVDPTLILSLLIRNWYFFAIGIILSLLLARFYINHTMPVYQTSITVLINETEDRPLMDNAELLQGLGLPGGMKNLENQIMILRSRELTERTLKELPFEIEYYFKTWRNVLPFYPDIPVKVITDNNIPKLQAIILL